MKQDFEFLDVLSLKLAQKDAYKLHSSNYGVIIGRVLANDAFGIPNAKISVFIERDTNDTTEIENIYPYTKVTTKDRNNIRYNLLPDYSDDECYRIVGTFPNKRLLLDDDTYLEVYDKYWKYTTVTNNAGDYMLFAVPTGSQELHVDIDLSDIGILSQKPRDFIYKGYNITEFDNASQFKQSTNLDNLKQIISQNKSVFVYPFWGDINNGIAAITRADIQVDYKFEPTCIFMGSIVSDNEGNSIGHKCEPSVDNGMNDQLVAGEGTIEMIRKTVDGLVEEYQIQGNRLIDSDGVWCYQIPMNLDYVGTDEYGNVVPTDNPSKGIPTRTQVRFRISKTETGEEGTSRHTAKYLVPMNPPLIEENNDRYITPRSALNGQDFEKLYNFGSSTPQSCFRDLYWNNVYSVKNYIPKVQVAHRAVSKNYGALKGSNLATDQNPIPFNKLRIDIPFMYMIVCILFMIILYIISFINEGVICAINSIIGIFHSVKEFKLPVIGRVFKWLPVPGYIGCISLGAGLSEDNIAYYPGCTCDTGLDAADCPEDMESNCKKVSDNTTLKDKIQQNLAQEYKIVKLDLYQDWINGCLYMPLWAWRKTKKKTYLFGLFSRSAKNEFCDCDRKYSRLKTYVTCDLQYQNTSLDILPSEDSSKEDKYHKQRRSWVRYENGLIKGVKNKDDLTVYYYVAMQPTNDNEDDVITNRDSGFTVARLYATDIILLGNINENNLYGIPQFFKVVPSTTANIPPIATIEEALNEEGTENASSDIGEGEDSGTTITTGMDWGARGSKQTPTYKTGLFLDLACTYASTRLKSCVNVERLSELGVNLDMSYNMSYSNGGNGIQRGIIDSDGFITKYELDDMENRSAFATLNHIGFVPQAYQDSISGYTTQVEDENTRYLVPKFKFIFPTDFDGRLQGSMTRYRNGFEQAMFDESDEAYLTFRLGAESNDNSRNGHYYGRTRHFYHAEHNVYRMPLYNNSFYFYFGINKGNTAIDKFNNLFLADCVQNEKDPFTLDVESRGKSYCDCMYDASHIGNSYGFIKVSSDDIQTPYSYTLYDSIGEVVVGEKNMTAMTFTIGDVNDKGKVKYQIPTDDDDNPETPKVYEVVDNEYGASGLTNQVYNLVVKDGNGKKVSRRIELDTPSLSFNYESFKLGTKFYDTELTSRDYICNEDDDYYGRIILSNFAIDGIVCDLITATTQGMSSEGYIVTIDLRNTIKGIDSSGPSCDSGVSLVYLTIGTLESDSIEGIENCFCNNEGTNEPRLKLLNDGRLQIDVYQPKRYIISMYQQCKGKVVKENSYSEIIRVPNGENFNTFLNGMPTEFILGTNSDTTGATIANTSKFYKSTTVTNATDKNICGWFGVHQEDSYQFGRSNLVTVEKNQIVWEDFLNFGENSIIAPSSKLAILKFKFESMFSLSDAVYSTGEFYYRAVGGVQPALYRSVAPIYNDDSKRDRYVLDDTNMVTVPNSYPNIVGGNYMFLDPDDDYDPVLPSDKTIPTFNRYYEDDGGNTCHYIGNYFAAFTNNGGYKNAKELDKTMSVLRSPSYASVSPYNTTPKEIGKTIEGRIKTDFRLARENGTQSLNGDKSRKVNPYLRALTVDRRLGYNLTVLGPVIGNTFPLYTPNLDTGNTIDYDRPWKGARIIGQIYGGIEMSYDRDYNIISANTVWDESGNLSAATPNSLLEYTYQLSSNDEDAKTIYNKSNAKSIIWQRDKLSKLYSTFINYKFDESGEYTICNNGIATFERMKVNGSKEWDVVSSNTYTFEADKLYDIKFELKDGVDEIPEGTFTNADGTPLAGIQVIDSSYTENLYDVIKDYYYPSGSTLIKRFYDANIGNVDIRDYFWSNFNKNRLVKYINDPITTDPNTTGQGGSGYEKLISTPLPYIFSYPSGNTSFYNGDFNRDDIIKANNYPTKRYIDICNIMSSSRYDLNISSCSYGGTQIILNEDGTLSSEVREGDGIELEFEFEKPIQFVEPSSGNKNFGNVVYNRIGNTSNGYSVFSADTAYLVFTITKKSSSDFDVYTALPSMIGVLPYMNVNGKEVDGITYFKTTTENGEIVAKKSIDNAIENVSIYNWYGKLGVGLFNTTSDMVAPDGIVADDELYINGKRLKERFLCYRKNWEYITSDSNDFGNVRFIRKQNLHDAKVFKNIKVFAILVKRYYASNGDSTLTNSLRTIETSELIDCRNIWLKFAVSGDSSEPLSYVELKNLESGIDLELQDTPIDDDDEPTTESVTQEGKTKLYSQTVAFEMKIDTQAAPSSTDACNQVFVDYNNMSFTFMFKHNDDEYFVDCGNVSATENKQGDVTTSVMLLFSMKLPQEMGLLYDDTRGINKWDCALLAKTSSGFSYKVDFKVSVSSQKLPQDQGARELTQGTITG
jgi:hypothetical protein